jgi:phenylacetate-CoA ligase
MLLPPADVLRTRYVRLPRWLKAGLAPALSILPLTTRYGAAYVQLRQQLSRAEWDPEFAKAMQTRLLRQVIDAAQRRSRFYRQRFAEAFGGAIESRSLGLEDLARLPILSREQVAADPESLLVVDPQDAELRQTSGSSGRPPLRIYLDRDRSVREMAFLHHIWSRIGYKLGDGRAILRDYGGHRPTTRRKWRYDPALRELWLSPFDMRDEVMDRYLELLHRYNVRWLYGVPFAIATLASHIVHRGWRPPASFRGVLPASETLFESQRRRIAEAFGGCPVLAFYGLSERAAIAGELPQMPGTYAFEPLYGFTELIDEDGKPITRPGRRGRIVSTGFISQAMPLIRYDTGDYGELAALPSAQNGYKLHVNSVNSRWSQEFVFGRNGEPISVISLDPENYAGVIREYQYYQDTLGKVVLRVVPYPGIGIDRLEAVLPPMRERVLDVMEIVVEAVSQIPAGRTGKRAFVDQRLKLPLARVLTTLAAITPAFESSLSDLPKDIVR